MKIVVPFKEIVSVFPIGSGGMDFSVVPEVIRNFAAFDAILVTVTVYVIVELPETSLKFSCQPCFMVKFLEVVIRGASPPVPRFWLE
jgi:hypothetical protein